MGLGFGNDNLTFGMVLWIIIAQLTLCMYTLIFDNGYFLFNFRAYGA